jgi:hypothetical protein
MGFEHVLKVAYSQKDFCFDSNVQKQCQITPLSAPLSIKSAQGQDLTPFFGDWSQNENSLRFSHLYLSKYTFIIG